MLFFPQKNPISHVRIKRVNTALFIHITYWHIPIATEKQRWIMWPMCTISCNSHIFWYHILTLKFRYKLKQFNVSFEKLECLYKIFRMLIWQNYIAYCALTFLFYFLCIHRDEIWWWIFKVCFFPQNAYFMNLLVCIWLTK